MAVQPAVGSFTAATATGVIPNDPMWSGGWGGGRALLGGQGGAGQGGVRQGRTLRVPLLIYPAFFHRLSLQPSSGTCRRSAPPRHGPPPEAAPPLAFASWTQASTPRELAPGGAGQGGAAACWLGWVQAPALWAIRPVEHLMAGCSSPPAGACSCALQVSLPSPPAPRHSNPLCMQPP